LEVVEVPGSHSRLLDEPNVRTLAEKISERLDAVQPHPQVGELSLGSRQIHVWHARLDRSEAELEAFRASLSPEEKSRAGRFLDPIHQNRFSAGRGILRYLLGRYLKMDPREIEFGYGGQGKPYLVGISPPLTLQFNLSHAHESALYAFVLDHLIGIDLERIDRSIQVDTIAAHFFAPGEVRRLNSLPDEEKLEAFIKCWTRKEAFIKAVGDGLAYPLDRFEVSFEPGEPARILRVEGKPGEEQRWWVHAWQPEPGFTAALVVSGQGWEISFMEYEA